VPKDRSDRERMARERETKVRSAREARERQEKTAREAQERARAQQQASRPRPAAGPSPGARKDPVLAKHYEVLEVAYGADWETVKSSYRRLMRKYHPDLHHKSPEKQKAANEVSSALSVAYNELERVLAKK
jgi:DnaJ-domain-containing protein 1